MTWRYHSHLHCCFRKVLKGLNSSNYSTIQSSAEVQKVWFRPYSILHARAFFFLSLNILGKQQSPIWGTQDGTKHQKQADKTTYKNCLAIFPHTLTDIKQQRQNCSLCCQPHPPHVEDKCRQSCNLNNYGNSFPARLLCSMELIQKSASY